MTKARPLTIPLSDDEYEKLAELLDANSPFDTDGLLGLLHAVAIAPSLMPPSTWIHIALPDGMRGFDAESAQEFFGLVMRLYNDVLNALTKRKVMMPEEDDVEGCDSFAAGFIAGAEADPAWVSNDDHWTFASWAAYLAGKPDLVSPSLLRKFEDDPETRPTTYKNMGAIVLATYDAFLKVRREALGQAPSAPSASATARVGRNEPCPCGSGKKYKRCCIDGGGAVTH